MRFLKHRCMFSDPDVRNYCTPTAESLCHLGEREIMNSRYFFGSAAGGTL